MHEIRALTGVRGFAALWVLFLHFRNSLCTLIPSFDLLSPVMSKGMLGVDLFFVLSGFIITYVYSSVAVWDAAHRRNYIIKRFARIYPVHLLMLLSLAALVAVSGMLNIHLSGNYPLKEFVYNIFLLQGFPFCAASWNYPSWSISAEFFGYLVIFPLTILIFRKTAVKRFGLFLSLIVMLAYVWVNDRHGFGSWENIARISFEFISGAALFHGLANSPSAARFLSRSLPFIIAASLIVCFLPEAMISGRCTTGILVLAFPLVIAGLSSDQGFVCRFLGFRPVRYFGLISYSLYMSHALVQKVFKVLLPETRYAGEHLAIRSLIFAAYILVPIIVAACLYHWWEEPARNYIQKRAGRRSQPSMGHQ